MEIKEVEVWLKGVLHTFVLLAETENLNTYFSMEVYREDTEVGLYERILSEYISDDLDHALERFNEIIVDAEEGDY